MFLGLPDLIINEIHEYNPQHRELYKIVLEKIPLHACMLRMKLHNHTISSHIDDPKYLMTVLSQCSCCDYHKNGRPENINSPIWYVDNTPKSTCHCLCKCYCGQLLYVLRS